MTSPPGQRFAHRIARLFDAIAALDGWRRYGVAFLLGFFSVVGLPPIGIWAVMFLTLPVFFLLIDATCERQRSSTFRSALPAGRVGWWFGFGYFLAGLHWLYEPLIVEADKFAWLIPFALVLVPGGLALFTAAATLLFRTLRPRPALRLATFAACLGLAEWLRGFILTGFPWNALGYALTLNDALLQWSGVFGIYGLSVLAPLVFVPPVLLLRQSVHRTMATPLLAALAIAYVALAAAAMGQGGYLLSNRPEEPHRTTVRLIQPAVPQSEKWKPENRQKIFDRLLDLSVRDTNGRVDDLADRQIVIWPESAIPFLLLRTPDALAAIADRLPPHTTLLTGGLRAEDPAKQGGKPRIYNALLAIDSDGKLIARYDKHHLVPFGEYLPLQPLLEWLGFEQITRQRGGFTAGRRGGDPEAQTFDLPGLPAFAPLICYEAIFAGEVVQGPRPEWLLVVTNDAWFGNWAGPAQHFHQARVRAVEEGLPMVRVSNNGISAVIAANGEIRSSLALNVQGTLDAHLPPPRPATFYARNRNLLFWCMVIGPLAAALLHLLASVRSREPAQP